MRVTFWGVRGSIATSGLAFAKFGGNTTCLEIEAGGQRIVIDAGTGIRGLGRKLSQESRMLGRPTSTHLLFTHLHWDHIQGFPFFEPGFAPNNRLFLYGPDLEGGGSLERALDAQMQPPSFPIGLDAMAADKRFYTLTSGDGFRVEHVELRCRALSHPQGCFGYRIDAGGRSVCFATDVEHPDDGSVDEALVELARDVDLLIYDAQFTPPNTRGAKALHERGGVIPPTSPPHRPRGQQVRVAWCSPTTTRPTTMPRSRPSSGKPSPCSPPAGLRVSSFRSRCEHAPGHDAQ